MNSIWLTVIFILCISNASGQSFFVENKGQWNKEVRFRAELDGAVIYLTSDGYSVLQYDREKWAHWMHRHADGDEEHGLRKWIGGEEDKTLHFHHYKVHFAHSSPEITTDPEDPLPYTFNYLTGNDIAKHASGVKAYRKVYYRNVYPHVDVEFITGNNGFKYNVHLYPGADPEQVKLLVEGADGMHLDNGQVVIHSSVEEVRENIPVSYVSLNGVHTEKKVHFELDGNTIGFSAENWNRNEYVVIDPEVVFSTYSGSTADNFGFTATYDKDGNLYAGGITTSPTMAFDPNGRYPATTGAFDVTYNGGYSSMDNVYGFACDITISKYSADGSTLLYATYLGGMHNEFPHSLVVNDQGQLIVFGTTFSSNFPVTAGAFQRNKRGESDIIVSVFTADGSGLVGSTFIGGNEHDGLNQQFPLKYFYADDFRGEVNIDTDGGIFVASCTYSSDFPVTSGSFQTGIKGGQEGVVFKFNPTLSSLEWATFLGGGAGDALYSIDFDRNGDVLVSGGTISRNFPGTENGKHPNYLGGVSDGIIAVLSPDGKSLKRATFWGSSEYDQILSLEVDDANKIYVVGQSQGKMPVIGEVYRNSNSGQFVTRFSNDLKEVEFSTVFGTGDGMPDITVNAFLVDDCRKIFISGWGGESSSKSFSSTRRLPVTPDAAQRTTDGSDFYLMVLSKNAEALLYATYFGGNLSADHVDGGTSRFDKKGVVYQSVCASCRMDGDPHFNDFPTTPGSFSPNNRSPRCSNAAFKIAFGNLNRTPEPETTVVTVMAFEELTFNYTITDPDGDTLDITFVPESSIAENLIDFIPDIMAIGTITRSFTIVPGCDDVTGDTVLVRVYVTDRGCPGSKDSIGYIKILVLPPPVLDPPETLCLLFVDGGVEISWSSIEESPYYDATLLYKVFPDGREEVLLTSNSTGEGKYRDTDVTNPKTRNYAYYIRTRNRCGDLGPLSIPVSTVKESESPIAVTTLLTATVVENRDVLVKWLHSTEDDFGSYDVYRYENFGNKDKLLFVGSTYSVGDTVLIDKDVDVQNISYCYVVVVRDRCGHVSANSNRACTIVLTGNSIPFAHDVWWNEYKVWENGVQEYMLYRCVDTGYLALYATVNGDNLSYHDDTLNYDWGGYWYEVRAVEKAGFNETSRSNRIYLIQPPLLHVPNAFTPNGDHLNELWGIVPVFVKTYHLQVYNRWGERVYESTEKKVLWDGFYQGLQAANNVYIYTITYTGWDHSRHHVSGTVTVLK